MVDEPVDPVLQSPAEPTPDVDPNAVTAEDVGEPDPKPVPLGIEEQRSLKGELDPGAGTQTVADPIVEGWLAVDAEGSPTGTAVIKPPIDTQAFPIRVDAVAVPSEVMTPSGAPIMDSGMNPSPQLGKYSSPAYSRDYSAPAEEPAAA